MNEFPFKKWEPCPSRQLGLPAFLHRVNELMSCTICTGVSSSLNIVRGRQAENETHCKSDEHVRNGTIFLLAIPFSSEK